LDKLPKTWVSHGTLGSDSGYLDQPWNTCVSLKVLG
jgi:hypothetical protein